MAEAYDIAVVGLGAIGSATAAELASRGHDVLGLDRFRPPHRLGSSHGETRLIREAYYYGSPYLPMVRMAYQSWADLAAESGRELLQDSSGLMIGPREGRVFTGTLDGVAAARSDWEALDAAELSDRFPAFQAEPGTLAIVEPRVGVLALENCLDATLQRARDAGAELRFGEAMTSWSVSGDRVTVVTERTEYEVRRLAFAAGAWTPLVVPELGLPLEVERTVQYWFAPVPDTAGQFDPPACPVWIWEYEARKTWYGFPPTGRGLKIGMHVQAGRRTTAEQLDRVVNTEEESAMREVLKRFMPKANGALQHATVCMYTNTPDEHFIVDHHPEHPEVVIFAGGSGHAFKFALVLGGLMSDLLTDERPIVERSHFSIQRF